MNSFGYAILGGIAGGAEGLIEQRRQEAEEAKAINLARFQQQLSQQNYEFQGKLDEQRDIAAEGREATREDEVRVVAGADEAGVAVFADKKGNLYRNGKPYTGPVYEKGLKRERDAMDFSKTYTDENGQIVAYDPKNPGAQYVVGKDGNYKPKGELSEAAQLAANARLSELNEMGVTDANVGEVNAIRKKLGLPTYKKVETKPADDGWFGTGFRGKPAEYEFKEDWQGEEPSGKPEVLPKMGGRENNLGNIRPKGASTGFQSYESPEAGIKAIDDNLVAYSEKHGINTLRGIINRWSPPNENDTEALVANAAKRTGFKPDDKLDMANPATRHIVSAAIMLQEHSPKKFKAGEAQAASAPTKEQPPTKPEIIPKQEKKWYDHPLLTGSLDAGELASKPMIAAADTARETVSAGVGAVKGVAQFANQLRQELTEQEYQALMREKGQRSDDEFFSLLKDFGIAGVKSWLNSGNISKNAEKFYGKPGNDLNKYLR